MKNRKTLAMTLLAISLALAGLGIFRNELRPIFRNAWATCYSCIGLQ
jgi:hypothetical protein